MEITIRRQQRKTLAFRLTADGATVLIPRGLEPHSAAVQQFIAAALAKLPAREPTVEPSTVPQLHALVDTWARRIGVQPLRIQVRHMHNKWGSISTAGTLTLADDVLRLPQELAEYVVVHELLHLKFPDHRQGWQVSMGAYLPDWRERDQRLTAYVQSDLSPSSGLST
jgi:predicted metal-dependent hydrolase